MEKVAAEKIAAKVWENNSNQSKGFISDRKKFEIV